MELRKTPQNPPKYIYIENENDEEGSRALGDRHVGRYGKSDTKKKKKKNKNKGSKPMRASNSGTGGYQLSQIAQPQVEFGPCVLPSRVPLSPPYRFPLVLRCRIGGSP